MTDSNGSITVWPFANPGAKSYKAFYSSVWDRVVTNPAQMLVPIDDHMVHRGDAVFEALRIIGGRPYLLDAHMDRLGQSSRAIAIPPAFGPERVKELIERTVKVAMEESLDPQGAPLPAREFHALVRLFLSRGSGSFSPNPYDCPQPHLYIVVTSFSPPANEKYERGVTAGTFPGPSKEPWLAVIKSCNYLQNVLMKKWAVDAGVDFAISVTPEGCLAEGSTENVIGVDHQGVAYVPKLETILRGTTMMRALKLGLEKKILSEVRYGDFSVEFLLGEKKMELAFVGTTLDVIPIRQWDQATIFRGDRMKALCELIRRDQLEV